MHAEQGKKTENDGSCNKAALNEHEDGKQTTSQGGCSTNYK